MARGRNAATPSLILAGTRYGELYRALGANDPAIGYNKIPKLRSVEVRNPVLQ